MTMIGTCYICGRPAANTCPLCGQLVCAADVDPITHVCRMCAKGARTGHERGPKVRRLTG